MRHFFYSTNKNEAWKVITDNSIWFMILKLYKYIIFIIQLEKVKFDNYSPVIGYF